MENKKGVYQDTANNVTNTSNDQIPLNETVSKHSHQHNTAPHHLRLLQYGLKIPNNQSQLNSPLHLHVHQHNQQLQYQTTAHRHLQTSPQFNNINIQPNPVLLQQQPKYAHQHQKPAAVLFQNQPPPLHPHNQIPVQNTPQIWVPHQAPPIHYHQIQNKAAEVQKPIQATTTTAIVPKPKDVVERKKSSNSNYQLRSPVAKRPLEAPVTMQGWLHKQGSEGLMLWKKRWFVLSEYCLFYYKGVEEEKLLGSILLPSYKVSICGSEDKVNKKFAFKCEHANMRTYILAADSQELMLQWIRVLNLACLLQNTVENDQTLSVQSNQQENTDTSIYQHQQINRTTPIHTHSSSNTTELSNPSQQELSHYNQPLYANAPPKPRRLNDGGYSSPSPDVLDRYPMPQQYVQPVHMNRNFTKSPVNTYVHNPMNQADYIQLQHRPKHNTHEYLYTPSREVIHNLPQNAERRTPDTYGRSKLTPTTNKQRQHTDYEDVYADQSIYKRPLSPIAYNHVIKKTNPPVNPAYRAYTPVNMHGPKEILHYNPPPQMRKSPSIIARPHSADFLEYEMNNRHTNPMLVNKQPSRPKSSLDINRNVNDSDNYFYSEERYAEKMRKSAQYLQNKQQPINDAPKLSSHYSDNDNTFPLMRSNTQPISFNNLQINDVQPISQPIRSRSVLSEGSLSKELDVDMRASPRESLTSPGNNPFLNYPQNMRMKDYEQFTRSASARLPPNVERMPDERPMTREGERKREESMKRLLEWKQRMLQSPLNRKVQGNRAYPGKADYYQMNPENGYLPEKYMEVVTADGRRSVVNLPQYNSYSSDDEENVERSKENVHAQAGRTLDTFPCNTKSLTPAHITSTTVLNTSKEPDEPLTQTSLLMHDEHNFDEHTFTKPLKKFNKDSSNLAHVSSLKSEYSEKFEQSPVVTEIKSNGALVKSILAEFDKSQNFNNPISAASLTTPTRDIDCVVGEENYMTMTPKKSILDPTNTFESVEVEENPYVEMSHNAILNTNLADPQHYELICYTDGKLEPVYMELKQPMEKKDPPELPDILMASNKGDKLLKSDSSDADDEASKDLDSLDTHRRSRFSLSDTFRPASYYLDASQTVPEFPDSSDSELVSPPPIPTSPPPLDDLDECRSSTQELNSIEQQKKDATYGFTVPVNRNSDQFFNSLPNANENSKFKKGSTQSLNVRKSCFSLNDPECSSICSTNTDPDRRYNRSRLSHNSDSDVELRMSSRNSDYERMLKRRPVSEDFCDELESADRTFDSVDLDRYLHELEMSNISLHGQDMSAMSSTISLGTYHDYENMFITSDYPTTIVKSPPDRSHDKHDDFVQRARSSSSASNSAEISGFLLNSTCSTPSVRLNSSLSIQEVPSPISGYFSDRSRDKGNSSAPYYYSDLSVNMSHNDSNSSILTLNNQRSALGLSNNKRDITHIINPIKVNQIQNEVAERNEDDTFKLAAEARSVSVDFLNLTDKSGHIDQKNIYESDTLKRQRALDPATRNLFHMDKDNKFNSTAAIMEVNVRRSHSLEGLLENVLSDSIENASFNDGALASEEVNETNSTLEGSYLWEEDSIWRERLRSASQRHTKSMENLDCIGETKKVPKKSPRGITRGVTYVNDNIYNMPLLQDKHKKEVENKETAQKSKTEIKKEGSFIIDREKLRQWDLLSSAPSDDQLSTIDKASQETRGNTNTVVEFGQGISEPTENSNAEEAASGSISLNTRDTFPRTISAKKIWTPNSQTPHASRSVTNLSKNHDQDPYGRQPGHFIGQSSSQHELNSEQIYARKDNSTINNKMNVSAGELLGRTHEELVLLLIQLRRQSSHTLQAIENSYNEIDTIQAQLHMMDQAVRLENLQKLDQIKQHLLDLEKQYEKGKPLVNLVDNMVKLGSLYRAPLAERNNITPYIRDRLEFNQQIQERRLLAEEKRDWNRLNPSHLQLQEKVQQLYQLDRLIHEESSTLQNLQQDKEDIERALGGLRMRLNKGFSDPAEVEQARKQQIMLENELSRVHLMLAQNSKKLEETVAGNARLEQELLVLKQKLQTQRQHRSSPQFSNAGDSLPCGVSNSAMLESDLQRVQKKIGDLQKQRQELSMQVRQLTDRSNSLVQLKSLPSTSLPSSQSNKRKVTSLWRETDLDTMNIVDHGDSWDHAPNGAIFLNEAKHSPDDYNRSDSTSDDTAHNLNLPQEKQEIKTVRIVKRESERRQRDREKTSTSSGKWDALLEEDDSSQNSSILFRPTSIPKLTPHFYEPDKTPKPSYQDARGNSSTDLSNERSPELSPIFKSEAARQIITEMSIQDVPKQPNRRAVPKEKRRHYTAPHNNIIMKSLHQLPTDDNAFDKMILNTRRARDDLDMERALRQRIDAPDVVRSTLSNKELKYNESTIDNLLGTPNKINIPERYIPEQLPQLSLEEQEHRLRKVESIKKMLSDTAIISGSSSNATDEKAADKMTNSFSNKATAKMIEEKKQREHLLQLNQILAKQVMEMSKIVAVKALAKLPLQQQEANGDDEDLSPITPLPLYQQRDNYYS